MINFAEIQDNIEHLQTREQAMAAILSRLETTVATLCASSRVDEMEQRFKDTFEQQHRALERLDVAQQIAAKVVEEMPTDGRGQAVGAVGEAGLAADQMRARGAPEGHGQRPAATLRCIE